MGFLDLENLLSLRWLDDWRLRESLAARVAADSSLINRLVSDEFKISLLSKASKAILVFKFAVLGMQL